MGRLPSLDARKATRVIYSPPTLGGAGLPFGGSYRSYRCNRGERSGRLAGNGVWLPDHE